MSFLSVEKIDVIFGSQPEKIFPLIDSGKKRQQIREKTGHTVAVQQASLQIEEGEIVVLMGLSGSGKSSLLRVFNGLNSISRGQIKYKNQPIQDLTSLRRHEISMVFQQAALLPWKTVAQNIALGLEIKHLESSKQNQIIEKNLERVGLSKWADSYPKELSGGMQQRVGLARALAMESPVLLMDEPFSALDPLIRSQLQNELLQLKTDLKKTILFVTHDFNEAILLGNKIVILEEGEIIQAGTPQEIVQNPLHQTVKDFVNSTQKHCLSCLHRPFA